MNSLSHPKRFILTLTNQSHLSYVTSEKPQGAQRSTRQAHLHPKIHRESIRSISIVYTVNEEGHLLYLGGRLLEGFEDIKEYLTKPPVLVSLILKKLFLLYVRGMDHSLGALLAQKNDKSFEEAIYYLSRILIWPKAATA